MPCAGGATARGDNSRLFSARPMSHVFHRDARHDYPVAVAGDGVYLIDRDGRRYLDASGGAAVSCLGHSDRAVREAIARQLAALPYAHTSFFTNEPMEALAERLVAAPPLPGYFRRLREVCDRHGILLILDEVMCGMGRCGTTWAFEAEAVVPDMVIIAKGLGAGYQPIGAAVVGRPIHDAIRTGSGFFQHGTTYHGHAAACAGALAVQRRLHEEGVLARV